nr:MAG TPA: hypothetical protein [Caudoviricetes sp.]
MTSRRFRAAAVKTIRIWQKDPRMAAHGLEPAVMQ